MRTYVDVVFTSTVHGFPFFGADAHCPCAQTPAALTFGRWQAVTSVQKTPQPQAPAVVRGAGRCRRGRADDPPTFPAAHTHCGGSARRSTVNSLHCRNMTTHSAWTPGQAQLITMTLLLLPLLAAAATIPDTGTNMTRPKFDACYGCICEAASRCNPRVGCNNGVCGLFQITKPYWLDAGSPTVPATDPKAPDAFEQCTTHTFCALETVQLYMARYGKDCNNDGTVGCYDFAVIHNLGPNCEGKVNKEYIEEFENCQFNVLLASQP